MSINCIALGKRICFYRLKFNITQEKLAALTNCSREYIAYLESGTKTPSLPTLIDLANVLHPLNYEGVAFIQAVPKAGYPGLASYMYHTCRSITAASSRSTTTPPTTCGIIKITNPPISI